MMCFSLPPSKITDFCHLPHQMEAHADIYALKNIVGDDAFHHPAYYLLIQSKWQLFWQQICYYFVLSLRQKSATFATSLIRERLALIFYAFKRIAWDYPGIVLSIIFSAFIYITTNSLLSKSLSATICTTRYST